MHIIIISAKRESMNLEDSRKVYIGGFGRRKGKGEMLEKYYTLKNKKEHGQIKTKLHFILIDVHSINS